MYISALCFPWQPQPFPTYTDAPPLPLFNCAAGPDASALSRAVSAMNEALEDLKSGREVQGLLTFKELRDVVGFEDYYAEEDRYKLK